MKLDNHELEIKRSLEKRVVNLEPSQNLFNRIQKDIYKKERSESMKSNRVMHIGGKKLSKLVVLGLAIVSVTVVGASISKSWVGHTVHKYDEFPSKEQVKEDVGFVPKYTETLPGGFRYIGGGIGEMELRDERGEVTDKIKNISLSYAKEGIDQTLMLGISNMNKTFVESTGAIFPESVAQIEGIELYYTSDIYKFVPPDYELTEEDKQAQEDGRMMISYGSNEVSVEHAQSLMWYDEGVEYSILGFDYDFEVEEMIEMAEYVIIEGK